MYVARNPKDTCVSFYHYCRVFHGMKGSFDDFAELMLQDSGALSIIYTIDLRDRFVAL